jgi:amino acid permease
MRKFLKDFLFPLSVFMGTIIGVGIFGLPHVALRAGFLTTFIYFILITLAIVIISLRLGEVVTSTQAKHRIPGYISQFLGKKWKKISLPISSLSLFGASLAYLVIGGEFLSQILSIPYFWSVVIFFLLGSILIFKGIKSISAIELILFLALIIIILLFFFKALPFIELENFTINPTLAFLGYPFGVILFSLWGVSLIPELKEMVPQKEKLKKVIITGVVFSSVLYLIYTVAVLGACGKATPPNSLIGFSQKIGGTIVTIGLIFGLITTFTSYIALGLTLKKIFNLDAKISHLNSWLLAVFVPFVLFILGLKNFIDIIGLTGSLLIGGESILILLLYKKFSFLKKKRFSSFVHYLLLLFIIMGVILEFVYFFKR